MSMSKLVVGRGREVLRGNLLHRKKGSGSLKRRAMIVYCGSETDGQLYSAIIALFDDYERVERYAEKKPRKVIQLADAKIEESTYSSPVGSHGTPPSGSNGTPPDKFLVVLANEVHEFQAESESMKVHWLKLLTLLTMFPHSVIPEEPAQNPISEGFRYKLDPRNYGAESAWAVYIMPEEVGSRCGMIGIHILLLKAGVPQQSVGRLEIVSPTNPSRPVIVAWDRDKMRRTGKTGNLVFMEIGRRCRGGPGLVWMYAGFEEAHPLRETLHRFLFQGDGKAVSIPTTHDVGIYSRPRSSVDMGLPSSYQKDQSVSRSYQYHQVISSSSGRLREDSGFKDSPISNSCSPSQSDVPPPIRLDKHPSLRRKQQHSKPCRVPHSGASSRCSTSPSESYGPSHSVGSFNDDELFDAERTTSRQSVSPPDEGYSENEESGSGQFAMDPDLPSQGSARMQQNIAAMRRSQEPCTYVTMTSPHAQSNQDEYVHMVSAPTNGTTIPRPNIPSHYDVPGPLRKKPITTSDSPSASPSNYENSGPLPTIEEAPTKGRGQSDMYENFTVGQLREEEFTHYRPNYENREAYKEQQRKSEVYQNVTLIDEEQQKRASMRRSSVVKEDVTLPSRNESSTPPSSDFHVHYAQRQTHSPADTSPPLPPRVPVVRETSTTLC